MSSELGLTKTLINFIDEQTEGAKWVEVQELKDLQCMLEDTCDDEDEDVELDIMRLQELDELITFMEANVVDIVLMD
jgi:hypothetical protein